MDRNTGTVFLHKISAGFWGLRIQKAVSQYPCVILLAGILSAVLPATLFPENPFLTALLPPFLTLLLIPFTGLNRTFRFFALPATVALCALFLHSQTHKNSLSALLNHRPAIGVELEFEIKDPTLCGTAAGLRDPRYVASQIRQLRFSSESEWLSVHEKIMAVFPKDHAEQLSYGKIFYARGILYRPEKPILPGGFDYGKYLNRRNIHYLFSVDEILQTQAPEQTFFRKVLNFRDQLTRSLIAPIKNNKNKALAAALIFGSRHGIEREELDSFRQSGTIHILTVSGLHVGLFTGAILFLLAYFPFRYKMLIAPVLTFFYVWMTGLQLPALRAVIMLFCWCIPKAFLRQSKAMNSVFLACSILLLLYPSQIGDAGFQYSFICVFFLILSCDRTAEWLKLLFEKHHWYPYRSQGKWVQFKLKCGYKSGMILAGSLTAWIAGFILTLYYQDLCVPFAMPANLLILPAAWCSFVFFTLGMIPGLLWKPAGDFFAVLQDHTAGYILSVCDYFARITEGNITHPPLWSIFAGMITLFLLLLPFQKKRLLTGACAALLLIFFWCSGLNTPAEAEFVILYGGKQTQPLFIYSDPDKKFSLIVNPADFQCTAAAANYLKQRGHATVSLLAATSPGKEYIGSGKYLCDMIRPEEIALPEPTKNTTALRETIEKAMKKGAKIHLWSRKNASNEFFFKTFTKNNGFSFDISENQLKIYVQTTVCKNSGMRIKVGREVPGNSRTFILPFRKEISVIKMAVNELQESGI